MCCRRAATRHPGGHRSTPTRVNAELFRIGDRQLAAAVANGNFLNQLPTWETDEIEAKSGVQVWKARWTSPARSTGDHHGDPVGALGGPARARRLYTHRQAINRAGGLRPKATQCAWTPISA
jgi:hypothetical protein